MDEGFSFEVMHALIRERFACSESTVRRCVHRRFPKTRHPVVRRATVPGVFMDVDFGYLGLTRDPQTGRTRKTWLFSGRLRHSRVVWRERVFDQKLDTFLSCHEHAFDYFGGVPANVAPDNLKAAVVRASFEEPIPNRTYRIFAEHCGFCISPCLPRTPQHKGGVENDIKYVKHNFWPRFREAERNRGRTTPDGDELVRALERWNEEVSETRLVAGVGRTPREMFESEEREQLLPLPPTRFERIEWKLCKVQVDWRIQFGTAFYSVPYRHIGATVQVCASARIVRIFRDFELICTHRRATRKWEYVSNPDHAPPNAVEFLSTTRRGLLRRAEEIGASVRAVAAAIFEDRAVDGLRPVRALLNLATRYSPERLRAACARALRHGSPTQTSVKRILARGLDIDRPTPEPQIFRFARAVGYFDPHKYVN